MRVLDFLDQIKGRYLLLGEVGHLEAHIMKEILNRSLPFINLEENLIAQWDSQALTDVGSNRPSEKNSKRQME